MNLNKAFKRSIARYLDGTGVKEINKVSEEPFIYTVETLDAIAQEILGEKREAKAKEEKKAKKKQCRRILSNGKRCSIRTTNKSELCYHHN